MSYVVFFEHAQPAPTEAGTKVIGEVAACLRAAGAMVKWLSHDRNATADPALSQLRVGALKKRLTEGGVKEDAIKTGDGTTPAQAGKRVDIFVNE